MKSHFPYFYDKYLCEKSVSTKLSKFQNFHMNCPLKGEFCVNICSDV